MCLSFLRHYPPSYFPSVLAPISWCSTVHVLFPMIASTILPAESACWSSLSNKLSCFLLFPFTSHESPPHHNFLPAAVPWLSSNISTIGLQVVWICLLFHHFLCSHAHYSRADPIIAPNALTFFSFNVEVSHSERNSSPQNENSVINYSPLCCSKPVRPLFIFGTQIKIFLMKSESFLTLHR